MKKFITIDRTKTIATEMIASVITKELNVDESSLEITLTNGKKYIVIEESLFIDEMFWLINKDIESNDYSGLAEQKYEMNYGEREIKNEIKNEIKFESDKKLSRDVIELFRHTTNNLDIQFTNNFDKYSKDQIIDEFFLNLDTIQDLVVALIVEKEGNI